MFEDLKKRGLEQIGLIVAETAMSYKFPPEMSLFPIVESKGNDLQNSQLIVCIHTMFE